MSAAATSASAVGAPLSEAGRRAAPATMSRLERLWRRLQSKSGRLRRWEFWPAWAVYGALAPTLLWLAARHRGVRVCAACNPGIPMGGFTGESKWGILQLLPAEWIVPSALVPAGQSAARTAALGEIVARRGWSWPIVLKPDVGCRGAGVKRIASIAEAEAYLSLCRGDVLAQAMHPGPHEAGVFYVREPGMARGRIFSITHKVFPVITGDGGSTLETLIWRHPRYRLQADVYLRRLGPRARHVPERGEHVPLAMAGNHCQGTMFVDGARLITPELEAAIDFIAQRTPGVHFGRFDVRYADPAEFAAGRGFQIVELNGLLSESTNIYDPQWSFRRAQRVLRQQWSIAYRIGAANLQAGAGLPRWGDVLREIRECRARDGAGSMSD